MINDVVGQVYHQLPITNRIERIWKLAKIDFKRRYYNDRLGVVWALLMPLFRISVYYVIFKYVFNYPEENYGLFLFIGLILWMFFVESVNKSMMVFRAKKYLIENIQFEKLDLFVSLLLSVGIGFGFNLVACFVIALLLGVFPSWYFLLLPLPLLALILVTYGVSLILSILKLYIKDIQHAWDIATLLGLWTSGIFFKSELLTEHFPWLAYAHPLMGIIDNVRAVGMYQSPPEWGMLVWNMLYGLILCVVGIFLFRRYSHKIIELL